MPDEDVAAELERAAARAETRGGLAAAAQPVGRTHAALCNTLISRVFSNATGPWARPVSCAPLLYGRESR